MEANVFDGLHERVTRLKGGCHRTQHAWHLAGKRAPLGTRLGHNDANEREDRDRKTTRKQAND